MPQEKRENFFTELLKFAFIAIVVVVPVRLFIAQPFIVSGASMVPTFHNAEYLIVDELSYHFKDPVYGDVVIFRYPQDTSQFFIKRVIGVPGDTILMHPDHIEVLQKGSSTPITLHEPYVHNVGNGNNERYTVPTGMYFVMGDNRPESSDSRSWGFVPEKNIVGRAFLRLLPIQTIDLFPGSLASH